MNASGHGYDSDLIKKKRRSLEKALDTWLYPSYTCYMKTAISIPDDLFLSAENTAKKLGIPRSQLFAKAIEEFIQNHSKENITDKLNEVYTHNINIVDNPISNMSVTNLRKSLKNDSW